MMQSELDYLMDMVTMERAKRLKQWWLSVAMVVSVVGVNAVFVHGLRKEISDLTLSNTRLEKDNALMATVFEAQNKSVDTLRKAGMPQHTIDRIVEEGCLMYFDVGGGK